MLFKISFKEESHLSKSKQDYTLKHLLSYVAYAFKKLPNSYHLIYVDEDGDQVNLDNQQDFQSLMQSGLSKVNIKIIQLQQSGQHVSDKQSTMKIEKDEKLLNETTQISKEEDKMEQEYQEFKAQPVIIKEQPEKIQYCTAQPEQKQQINIKKQIKQSQQKKSGRKYEFKPNEEVDFLANEIEYDSPKISKKTKFLKELNQKKHEQHNENKGLDPRHNFIHDEVKCDKCGVSPIIGNRYKCTVCFNYDVCQDCQSKQDHDHAFIKIRFRDQEFERIGNSIVENVGNRMAKCASIIKSGITAVLSKPEQRKPKLPSLLKSNIQSALDKLKPMKQNPKPIVKEGDLSEEDRKIELANYLNQILGLDFNRCYSFVKKYPSLNKEELIVQYFKNVKEI